MKWGGNKLESAKFIRLTITEHRKLRSAHKIRDFFLFFGFLHLTKDFYESFNTFFDENITFNLLNCGMH